VRWESRRVRRNTACTRSGRPRKGGSRRTRDPRGRHRPRTRPIGAHGLLDGQRGGGTRARVHHHYLKGTLWCYRCRRRLMIMRGKGKKGDLYFYFICRGRQDHTCDLPYVPVAMAEDAVERYYNTVALPADLRARDTEAMDNAITPRTQPGHLHAALPQRGRERPARHRRRAHRAVRAAHARAQGRTTQQRWRCPPGQRHRRRR
jgi:hypothetical protein